MSSRLRNLFILLGVLLVVVIAVPLAFFFLEEKPQETPDSKPKVDKVTVDPIVIVDKSAAGDVASFTVTNEYGTFTVSPRETDGLLSAESYVDLPRDASMIDALCDDLLCMEATVKTTAEEADVDYGLDAPTATITATYGDGSCETFVFGKEAVGTKGYYCRYVVGEATTKTTAAEETTSTAAEETTATTAEETTQTTAPETETEIVDDGATDTTLYIVPLSTVQQFLIEEKDLIGKTLIVPPSPIEEDKEGKAQLLTMELGGTCRSQPVRMITDTEDIYSDLTTVSTYVIESPFLRSIDSDEFYMEASTMLSLTAAGIACPHPTEEQLESYGLTTNPHSLAKLTFAVVTAITDENDNTTMTWYNERTHTIVLGNKDENGNYYALVDYQLEDGETHFHDTVYLLSPDTVPWAELTFFDLTDKRLFLKSISTVESMTITDQGEATTFSLTHHENAEDVDSEITIKANDKVYGTDDFRTLYQMMILIHRTAEKDVGFEKSGDAKYRIQIEFNDGSDPYDFSFYEMSASRYLLVTGDGEEVAVSISETDEFFKQYARYLAGEPVQTTY